jgi:Bifunctional DNA primase/polymerase, N-terminal
MTTSPSKANQIVKAALTYARSGLSVVATGKNKIPLNPWKHLQNEIPSEESIKADFSKPGTCVAIITGRVSGNVETIDFDFNAEKFSPWKDLVEKDAPNLIDCLVIQKTQSGGCHVTYRCVDGQIPGNTKLASSWIQVQNDGEIRYKNKKLKPIKRNGKFYLNPTYIETRGEGGYFLADPSPGYQIEQHDFSKTPNISPEEREILIEAAMAFNECPPEEPKSTKTAKIKNPHELSPGDDFDQRGDVVPLLLKHGWTNTGRKSTGNVDPGEHWRRPGKERGQSATLFDGKRLYVFSTNGAPFESDGKYSPFAIYAMLEHGGDFSAAAKALYSQGYGSKREKELKPFAVKDKTDLSFPYHVMTGAAGYFADTYVDYIEAPAQFLFIAYLACLGAVISPRLRLRSVLDTQARIFAVLLGESATERKSTTLNIVAKHFKSVVEDFNICWGVGSAEGLQKVLNRKTRNENKPMGTLLTYDELKAFVSKCNIDSSVLLPIVNTLFESNLYETHTKKQDINIDDAYLSMMAATTINTYNRIYNAAFLDIGFPNRIFLVSGTAERKHSIPQKVPEYETDQMKNHLIKVLQHVGQSLELDVTPKAKEIYHKWYMSLEQTLHAKRLDTYSLRFMMLLAVNNLKREIDADTVNDAIALCNWQLEIRKMYDPIDAEGKTAKMEESIRRVLKREPLKDYQLKQATGANRAGLWVFESAKKNLERSKEIAWGKKDKQWFYIEPQ